MRYIEPILKPILVVVLAALFVGCGEKGVIEKDTMADIVAQMYLADQFVESTPDVMGKTDSMSVYPAVIARNGHTVEEYIASVTYYLQKDDEYAGILKKAMASMEDHVAKLDEEIERLARLRRGPTKWWALDSVRNMASGELLYNTVMRGVRWMVIPGERLVKWAVGDSAVVDIPQNPQWWKNTLNAPLNRKFSTYFYGEEELEPSVDSLSVAADSTQTLAKDSVSVSKSKEELQRERAEKLRNALMYGKMDDKKIITEEVEEEEIELP